MNSLANAKSKPAFTLIELLVVIAIIAIVAAMLLPRLSGSSKPRLLICQNNLRQISLGYVMWSSAHTNFFPWEVSTNTGGTLELIEQSNASDHFVPLTPYLRNPALLICPADRRKHAANSYAEFSNTNLSYFVSLEASLGVGLNPSHLILAGDRHLAYRNEAVFSGLISITNFAALGWQAGVHGSSNASRGLVAFADGHVEHVKSASLPAVFQRQGLATNKLVIP
jgi:prepilin-type N-terminal cleavage/methylation domain-containing protein/prepilin-type processing-associated H-X9-DG protein